MGTMRATPNSRRQMGKVGTQQRNKDHLGAVSGTMGREDRRKDKYGTMHNQDRLGLLSTYMQEIRQQETKERKTRSRRKRLGSRG